MVRSGICELLSITRFNGSLLVIGSVETLAHVGNRQAVLRGYVCDKILVVLGCADL